ncbi:MAG: PAS domain S-box protein [bacterium]
MENKSRILILDDLFTDAELTKYEIIKYGLPSIIHIVHDEIEYTRTLYEFHPDIVLSDYSMPMFDGMRALEIAKKYDPLISFILVTGSINEDTAVGCMKAGADDYVIKEHLSRLGPAIQAALDKSEIRRSKRAAEATQRESEKRYRLLFNSNPNPMWVYDVESSKFLIVNDEAIYLYGYSREEFLSMTVNDIRVPDEIEQSVKDIKSLKKTVERAPVIRHKKKDGSIIEVEIISHLFTDVDGAKKRLTLVNDVTEKRKTEATLQFERYLMDSLMDNSPDHIYFKDVNSRFIRMNKAQVNRFSLNDYSEAIGKSDYDFFSVEHADQAYEDEQRIIMTGEPIIGFEEKETWPDGSETWVSTTKMPLRDMNGNIIGTFGVSRDVTKRKLYEKELKKLYQAVEQSPVSIVITDLKGNIEFVNKSFEETTGYTLLDVYQNNPRILKSGHTSHQEYEVMWNTISSGKTWAGEFCNKKKDGEYYWESAVISPIVNNSNEIINYLAVKLDITEKKRITDELILAKERAEKSDRLKSEFLIQISHEIRTPLNVISSFNDLLKLELEDKIEKDLFDGFEHTAVAVKRIIRTVELMIHLSEVYTGTFEYQPEIFNLQIIINDVYAEYKEIAERKRIDFKIVSENNEIKLFADESTVREIFTNIIDNALKFTTTGGVKIEILEKSEKAVNVVVTDTGIGIDEAYMSNLFKPFMQEERGYTRSFDGNGLGLALVSKYCDMNNAKIAIESVKGKGTKVTVSFNKYRE